MTTEKQLQQGIQDTVQTVLPDENVTINNTDFMDAPQGDNSSYFVILNSDDFLGDKDTVTANTSYQLPAILFTFYKDEQSSHDQFRDDRQSIINAFDAVGTARSAGGIDGVNIRRIRPGSPIGYILADPDNPPSLPVWITQSLIFEVEFF